MNHTIEEDLSSSNIFIEYPFLFILTLRVNQ
jgi:hypothetical protein